MALVDLGVSFTPRKRWSPCPVLGTKIAPGEGKTPRIPAGSDRDVIPAQRAETGADVWNRAPGCWMIHITSGSVPGLLVLTLKEVKMGGERFTIDIKYLFVRSESGNLEKAAISSAAQHLHKRRSFCSLISAQEQSLSLGTNSATSLSPHDSVDMQSVWEGNQTVGEWLAPILSTHQIGASHSSSHARSCLQLTS